MQEAEEKLAFLFHKFIFASNRCKTLEQTYVMRLTGAIGNKVFISLEVDYDRVLAHFLDLLPTSCAPSLIVLSRRRYHLCVPSLPAACLLPLYFFLLPFICNLFLRKVSSATRRNSDHERANLQCHSKRP